MDIFTDSNDQPKIILHLHLHNITAFLSLQLEPSQAGRRAANWEIRLLISAICALVLPAAACQGFVGRDNWKLERRWQSHGSLIIAPFSSLSSSAAMEKHGKIRNMFNQLFSCSEGFWEVQETSNKKTSFELILFVYQSVYWTPTMAEWDSSTKLAVNDPVPSASTHLPPVRLRAGSAVQLAPGPTKNIVEKKRLAIESINFSTRNLSFSRTKSCQWFWFERIYSERYVSVDAFWGSD